MRRIWRTAAWITGYGLSVWAIVWLGSLDWIGMDWSDPVAWLTPGETEVLAARLAWATATLLLAWITISTLAYLLARLVGFDPASVDWLAIGPVRKAVDTLVAGSMLFGTVPAAGASVQPASPEPVVAVDPAYVPVPAGREDTRDSTADDATDPPDPTDKEVVVEPGDHLWKLAEERMREVLGRTPEDSEVAPYWRKVIDVNRSRLRSGDPDLIFPGEEIVLPPPDALGLRSGS